MNTISNPQYPEDHVILKIDYALIDHFSNYLYSSPNKALEELVANSYDAWATEVLVFTPNYQCGDCVIVWDNGFSMDKTGLKSLWWIARSPKVINRTISLPGKSAKRKVIGKFGIGKLASYTVGDKITHYCKSNNVYLKVTVDYRDVKKSLQSSEVNEQPVSAEFNENDYYSTPIVTMSQAEIEGELESLFLLDFDSLRYLFEQPTWTMAVISDLKRQDIHPARLRWILGNSMPLRKDFKIKVDGVDVKPKLSERAPAKEWDFSSTDLQVAIDKAWKSAEKKDHVSGSVTFGKEVGIDSANPDLEVSFVNVPDLGKVYGSIHLYHDSLHKTEEYGRSYGFFINVNGRLINLENDRMFFSDPSFRTFYRSQFIIYADGLDEDILADRESIKRDTTRSKALTVIQHGMYQLVRSFQDKIDDEIRKSASRLRVLPVDSRELYFEPLNSLVQNTHMEAPGGLFDTELKIFRNPEINRGNLGDSESLSSLRPDGNGFTVNIDHPYFKAIESTVSSSKVGGDVLKEIDKIAVYEQLFKGYLIEIGIKNEVIEEISHWRDSMYRSLATVSRTEIDQLSIELFEASYQGKSELNIK